MLSHRLSSPALVASLSQFPSLVSASINRALPTTSGAHAQCDACSTSYKCGCPRCLQASIGETGARSLTTQTFGPSVSSTESRHAFSAPAHANCSCRMCMSSLGLLSGGSAGRGFAASAHAVAGTSSNPGSADSDPGAETISQIRARIFGEPIRKGEQTGRRALAKKLVGDELASWYFLPAKETPGFHNEEREYVKARNDNKRKKKEEDPDAGEKKKKKKR